MSIRTTPWICLIATVLLAPGVFPTQAQEPPVEAVSPDTTKTADTTITDEPPTIPDSLKAQPEQEISEILEWLDSVEADSADTAEVPLAPIMPPVLSPLPGLQSMRYSFGSLAASPHTAFSDHLLWQAELDAPATTDYGNERVFTYRGLNPLAVRPAYDGVDLDMRRPTFPQTMAPDMMVIPPYMFTSFVHHAGNAGGLNGDILSLHNSDSLLTRPYSDFFVRRGDYGLSLTQGRLFRPLPAGRSVNLGFSFAQSDGRDLYDRGDNRYLYARVITPVHAGYNLAAGYYQYRSKSDIQTAIDFWRYHFRRDDLAWRFDALVFRGDSIQSPLLLRLVVDHDKQKIETQPSVYRTLTKKSRALLSATYTPRPPDSSRGSRVGAIIALRQFHTGAQHFRRPEYTLWAEHFQNIVAGNVVYVRATVDGNDDDAPGPQLVAGWHYTPTGKYRLDFRLRRRRMTPSLGDREWLAHSATFEDHEERIVRYSESGNPGLSTWWSNSVSGELEYRPSGKVSFELSGWGSYEQDYFYWHNQSDDSLTMTYRPGGLDARTIGVSVGARLTALGPFSARAMYVYKHAEETTGQPLPGLIDHRAVGGLDGDLTVRKFNLELHTALEFLWWRAPTVEHTSYNRRDVFRTDLLGSATIKQFTIYWLAQNFFNYGYRKAPGYVFLGRTIMWGLHLRFLN